ncbi:hypothetical protein CHH59_16700 [Shouchella clausii]|uniref:Uncharacterized protein n=3 Tax=Bacillaceae TaxID=186817 RepID=A0A268RYU1_SHOCL|nr:hypothetical protein CHH54_12370 [Bacillus sp. 7520-S]PAE95823.1 hypothetical protein CHH71_14360 [Shouchella clausii]PAF03882.1 hypothetical protein CHH66_17545 [Shouchella clausii]PAF12838.1 hypothetical protein CHH59_16700 [Shouchella clausii]PAF25423.1 hypothetical protein CHH61_13780 [Shouchella clausii]
MSSKQWLGDSGRTGAVKGAVFIAFAALMAKVLSAVYRIPFQNIAGDFGFYVYQQIYPFYGTIAILALYGFPVVISRQVAEKKAQGLENQANELARQAFVGMAVFAVIASIGFAAAAPLVAQFMGDERLAPLLRLVSVGFLFLPILSVGRGVGQGYGDMKPTAFSHIGEQLLRVAAIIFVTYALAAANSGPYMIGTGAVYGSLLGSFAGCIIVVVATRQIKWKKWKLSFASIGSALRQSTSTLSQSVYVCINALVLLLFQMVDVFTVVRLLQEAGLQEEQAYLAKGVYDRGQPLIQLGTVLATSLALALVPLLAKALAGGKERHAQIYRDAAVRMTILLGGGAAIGLVVLMGPVNHMLFTDRAGTDILQVVAVSIFPASLYLTAAAILQGYGKIHIPLYAVAVGLAVKLAGNLLFIPVMASAMGGAYASLLAFLAMAAIALYAIRRQDGVLLVQKRSYISTGVTLFLLFLVAYGWKWLLEAFFFTSEDRVGDTVIALSTSLVGVAAVACCLLASSVLTLREWASVPKLANWRRKAMNILK